MTEQLHFHFLLSCIGEGNGNPLQCSCLENPRDGGAWWAAFYGVTQSQTRLKWLSSSSSSSMYGCESWTIKKAEHQRTDVFELWCWRRLLRIPWTTRRSNQSILKEISPGCSLEGLMLKLTLQYFGHLMQRADSFEKTLMLGKIEGRRRGWQKMRWLKWHHWLNGHEFGWTRGVGDGQGGLECCSSWSRKSRTQLSH